VRISGEIVCFCFPSLALSVCELVPLGGCSKARVKKKMALQVEVETDADQYEGDVEENLWARGAEEKYVYNERQIVITAGGTTDQQRGWVCTFANTGLNGTADFYDAVSLGKPVVGNFIKPKRFDWKLNMTCPQRSIAGESTSVTNMITFRLIFLLVWEFPRDIVLGSTQFLSYYLDNSNGNRHQSFLHPDLKEKVKVLYDCNHTLGKPVEFTRSDFGNVSQAGYVVPPFAAGANPGWIVPAVSTSVATNFVSRYGGLHMFLSGNMDLSGEEMALWRDPLEEEEQQIVPCIISFIVCQDLFHFTPAGGFGVASRPTTTWEMYTRLVFTDD